MAQRKLTKPERTAGVRAYDRMMDARGEPWNLRLIMDREGEEVVLATFAQFKKRAEFTPEMKRKVVQAVRLAASTHGKRDTSFDWLMPESYVKRADRRAARQAARRNSTEPKKAQKHRP